MKKLIVLAIFGIGLCAGAKAEDGAPTMTITGSFDPVTIEVADISRITFDGSKMVIGRAGGNVELDIADVTNMTFDGEFLSEESVEAEFADEFQVRFDRGVLSLSVAGGASVDMALYNVKGQWLAGQAGITGEWSMSLTDLKPGVYIIRLNNKTFKFTR